MLKSCDKFNSKELKEKIKNENIDKIIIPFGSFESHGEHMPLGTDSFISTKLSEGLLKKLNGAILLPGVPFGTSIHYDKFMMSVSLRYDTLVMLAEDILRSVIKYGFKKIIIINGHDGNIPALEIACRKIKSQFNNINILYIPGWWFYSSEKLEAIFHSHSGRGHAGEAETSLGMYLNLEGIDINNLTVEDNSKLNKVNKYRIELISDILERSKKGSTGISKEASYEKGEKIYKEFILYLTELIGFLDNIDWDISI
ncbi:creatininase family protein [Tissierella praeacuta]|uniref:creatininase family protein n=1 Tax=Tissierella praeacuta TaxID=43131 RepID=UPI0028A9FDEB|nr:creatininase family protein [Tissierella praeacuta]